MGDFPKYEPGYEQKPSLILGNGHGYFLTDFTSDVDTLYTVSTIRFAFSDVEAEAELQAEPGDADDDPDPARNKVCTNLENFTRYLSGQKK